MPKSPIRILAYALLVALCAIAHPALAQVAPRMTIDSIPPGANVYIDGALQGQSGPNFKVRISKGQHKLVLELDGHKRFEQQISVSVAQKLTYPLEKAPARLDIKFPATNDGAKGGEVFVDGAPAGVVPVLVDLPPGRHLVEIRKPGQKAYTETVEIKAAETRPVWVTMQADQRVGAMLIAADVPADVLVDGQPRGQAPVVVDNLNEGEHLVEVRRAEPGAPPWRQTVRVAGNQQTKVFAQTTPPPPAQGSIMVVSNIPDVEIFIDGAQKGQAGTPINVPPGQHSLTVQAKGHKPLTKIVEVEAQKAFAPVLGSLASRPRSLSNWAGVQVGGGVPLSSKLFLNSASTGATGPCAQPGHQHGLVSENVVMALYFGDDAGDWSWNSSAPQRPNGPQRPTL
mgnify:CR=1 FL=1